MFPAILNAFGFRIQFSCDFELKCKNIAEQCPHAHERIQWKKRREMKAMRSVKFICENMAKFRIFDG